MKTANEIVESLASEDAMMYLEQVLEILYGQIVETNGDEELVINPSKECGADEIGYLCNLLDPLVS